MIRKKTLLILGAGASYPYGFPLGAGLITRLLSYQARDIFVNDGNYDYRSTQLHQFQTRLKLSRSSSIDYFLNQHPDLAEFGKFLVYISITGCESEYIHTNEPNEDWYARVWDQLREGANKWQDLKANQLKVITFNYDNSIENYMFEAFTNMYQAPALGALDFVSRLNVIHVFGDTSASPVDGVRKYGEPVRIEDFELTTERAQSLLTIHERSKVHDKVMNEIELAMQWPDKVIVLGFGFHTENIDIIDLPRVIKPDFKCDRYFSARGMSMSTMDSKMKYLYRNENFRNGWEVPTHYLPVDQVANHGNNKFLELTGALFD